MYKEVIRVLIIIKCRSEGVYISAHLILVFRVWLFDLKWPWAPNPQWSSAALLYHPQLDYLQLFQGIHPTL